MGISRRLLGSGEQVVFHLRTHIKRIIGWLLLGLLIIAAAIAGTILMPIEAQPIGIYAVWAVAILVLFPATIVPWLTWLSSTYTITDRRVITRSGIFNRRGHDIPLTSISNVAYDRSLVDRMFGCGTLILETSADDPLMLDDIPNVEKVHVRMTELLHRTR